MPCGHSLYIFSIWHHYMDLGGNQLKSFLGGETVLKLDCECGIVQWISVQLFVLQHRGLHTVENEE